MFWTLGNFQWQLLTFLFPFLLDTCATCWQNSIKLKLKTMMGIKVKVKYCYNLMVGVVLFRTKWHHFEYCGNGTVGNGTVKVPT